jgi:site-specific DNA-methyltransferase (adenine-specific)
MVYNPQNVTPFTKKRVNYVKTTSAYSGGHEVGTEYEQKGYGYPTNLIPFKNESPKTQVHPTQKPVELMEYLIKTYTNEGESVLDFTMGSGSTGVACVNLNRSFIGIELDEKYFEIASSRIQGKK